jgi:hypothetical protein
MPKKTLSDYRKEYKDVTGKNPAVRWTITEIKQKLIDFKILKAGHEHIEKSKSPEPMFHEKNPDFEALVSDQVIEENVTEPEPKIETRGGFRSGAGRPVGQTDERARIERLMELEKPDLGVLKVVQGFNLVLSRFSPLPFTKEQCESIALGVTLPLYYWFPSVQGAANKWTLHLTALEYIGRPLTERAMSINQMSQPKEPENVQEQKENNQIEIQPEQKPADEIGGDPAKNRTQKKHVARSRSHAK